MAARARQAATGLTKSSIYAAYGSKEGLFLQAVERYHRDYLRFRQRALEEPTPRGIAEQLLQGMVNLHINSKTPRCCLEVNAGLACAPETESIREKLAKNRTAIRSMLRKRFEATADTAELPPGQLRIKQRSISTRLFREWPCKRGTAPQGRP